MAPERSPKRQKISTTDQQAETAELSLQPASNKATANDSTLTQAQRSSWFNSWSRKVPVVTELASESLRSISPASSYNVPSSDSPKPRSIRSPSLAMTLGKTQSNRSLPANVTITKINAEANSPVTKNSSQPDIAAENADVKVQKNSNETPVDNHATQAATPGTEGGKEDLTEREAVATQRSSWLGWLGKNEDKEGEAAKTTQPAVREVATAQEPPKSSIQSEPSSSVEGERAKTTEQQPKGKSARRSWLPWSSDDLPSEAITNGTDEIQGSESKNDSISRAPINAASKALSIKGQSQLQSESVASSVDPVAPPSLPHDGAKPSAWAFWSRERKANASSTSVDRPQEGEIAISDTPSQGQPKKTSMNIPKSDKKVTEPLTDVRTEVATPKVKQTTESPGLSNQSTNVKVASQKVLEQKPSTPVKIKGYQNILLPELQATLKLPDNPTIIQQLARLLYITKEPELKHLSFVKDPPKIRNALAIGVHGYFPAPLIRTVIGQPTGTSIKFADMASKAIKRWTKNHGYDCDVKTAALEGEGKIAERVELLWKLLLNWIEEIRKSDFVLVACHSQGVPVAIMLVAKLIQFGCLSGARVGICAMAGVNMGPFVDYKSRFIGGSAGELFDFTDPASKVSQEYFSALETVVKFGARVTYIGSIDDQLVSLESSIFSSVSHPHIYRAVSIDSRLHAPNFLSHLVGFALKLRNLGIQDHGLIRELSSPLAGSLYTGDGHSRLYEDDNCYDMAVDWSLLTTSMADAPLLHRPTASAASNPYILPFAMRGILEEDFVKTELQGEASELLRQFDEWKPTTKVLKDVKFRLEGIRSKL